MQSIINIGQNEANEWMNLREHMTKLPKEILKIFSYVFQLQVKRCLTTGWVLHKSSLVSVFDYISLSWKVIQNEPTFILSEFGGFC